MAPVTPPIRAPTLQLLLKSGPVSTTCHKCCCLSLSLASHSPYCSALPSAFPKGSHPHCHLYRLSLSWPPSPAIPGSPPPPPVPHLHPHRPWAQGCHLRAPPSWCVCLSTHSSRVAPAACVRVWAPHPDWGFLTGRADWHSLLYSSIYPL